MAGERSRRRKLAGLEVFSITREAVGSADALWPENAALARLLTTQSRSERDLGSASGSHAETLGTSGYQVRLAIGIR